MKQVHAQLSKIDVKLIFSAGTYSTDDFKAKVKVAVLQQRKDLEEPQQLKTVYTKQLHVYGPW